MVQQQSIPPLQTALSATTRSHPTIVDIRAGALQVRLAQTTADIEAAQALRYRIFYERLGAQRGFHISVVFFPGAGPGAAGCEGPARPRSAVPG